MVDKLEAGIRAGRQLVRDSPNRLTQLVIVMVWRYLRCFRRPSGGD
jgi:hypothetical protein